MRMIPNSCNLGIAAASIALFMFGNLPLPSNAATSAQAFGNGCSQVSSDVLSDAVSALCGTASAFAQPGRIGVRAQATAIRNTDGRLETTGFSSARAFFSDTLSFSLNSGFFRIPIDVFGSIKTIGNVGVNMSLSGGVGGVSFQITPGQQLQSINNALIPIVNGTARINAGARADAGCPSIGGGETCQIDADLSNSIRILGGVVLDLDGNELSGVLVTSESGFDYLKGFEPHAVATVPLPASILLLGSGIGGLALLRRRKRRILFG